MNRGASIATIYATDYAEVRLPIHDEELAYLNLPFMYAGNKNAALPKVILRSKFGGSTHEWFGEVVRTEGELDPKTRMVNVVASVPSPYQQQGDKPPLSVGLFVEAEIIGAEADDVVVLPRSALRGGRQVYVIDAASRLQFRQVEVLRLVKDEVYIVGGLAKGDRVCISSLISVIEGMRVRVHESSQVASS